jgi:hypothetical protein
VFVRSFVVVVVSSFLFLFFFASLMVDFMELEMREFCVCTRSIGWLCIICSGRCFLWGDMPALPPKVPCYPTYKEVCVFCYS